MPVVILLLLAILITLLHAWALAWALLGLGVVYVGGMLVVLSPIIAWELWKDRAEQRAHQEAIRAFYARLAAQPKPMRPGEHREGSPWLTTTPTPRP
jgi:hypothetical protein